MCWALGAACLALTISGCAALRNFPGKERLFGPMRLSRLRRCGRRAMSRRRLR